MYEGNSNGEEKLFHDFFEGNQAIKLLLDPVTGDICEANMAACDFYGYSSYEFCGMNFFALNAGEEAKSSNLLKLMKSGSVQNFNVYHKCSDGTIRHVSLNSGMMSFRGREFILLIVYDITGKRRAETVQQVSQSQFLTVLNSMDAMIYVADLRTNVIIFANRYMKDTFGEDIAGRRCWEVIHGYTSGPCSFCANERLTKGNEMLSVVHRWEYKSRKNGMWYQSIDRAIVWIDGRLVRITIAFDVTERKTLEREIISVSEQERIRIGHNLHDGIGQYFTGIGFLAKMLKDKLETSKLPEKKVAEEILSLIEEGKSHTRSLAKGLSPVNMDNIGIIAAVKELCMDIKKIFNAECSFICDDNISLEDNFTATHLYYIIREAVNNAMRHGQAKRIDIIMKETDDGMSVEINDDGTGFNPATVQRGLGLNLMKYRADVIGGELKIASDASGTSVTCFCSGKEQGSGG